MSTAGRTSAGDVVEPTGRQDTATWFAVAALALYTVFGLSGAGGRALPFTFPAGCLFVGLLAYVRSPRLYVSFTWWVWLLTPLIRRVFDLRYGYHPTSTLLLAPLLLSAVALFTVVRRRLMLRSSAYVPFMVASAALAYAFLIGVIRQSATAAAYDLFTWIAPLVFGLHLALEWRQFPTLRSTISSCVLWGLLVTSLYGIAQWIDPLIWDRVWVVSAEMQSVGSPTPFVIRVFSTLNAPGPFSIMLIFALLLGLHAPQRWRAVPLALGLVALILTKGRSAWGAFFVGALVLQFRQPLKNLPRQWLALLAVFLLAAPLITQPRVLSVLSRRAGTVANLERDQSYQSRIDLTKYALGRMAVNPAGTGLGGLGGATKLLTGGKVGNAFDSAPLEIYSVMGWIGGTLFIMSLVAIILSIARGRRLTHEPTTSGAVAVVVALLAASLFGNIFTGVSGFFFWTSVGIATAGRTYAMAYELVTRYAGHPELVARNALRLAAQTSSAA